MKNRITVLFVLVLVLLLLSPVFAAGTKEAAGPVNLTFVETITSPSRTAQIMELIAKYEARNPNVKINLVSPPYEQSDNKLTLMLNSNQELDIIEVRDHTVKQFVNNKKLVDLTPYLAAWDEGDDLLPLTIAAANTVDDTPYLLPQFFYVKGLFVRTDVLAKYGFTTMPKTTDELYAMSKAITGKDRNQYGFGFRGKGSSFKISDILILSDVPNISADNIYQTEDGRFAFSTPEARKAVAAYVDLYKHAVPSDGVNWGFSEQVNAFISGKHPVPRPGPRYRRYGCRCARSGALYGHPDADRRQRQDIPRLRLRRPGDSDDEQTPRSCVGFHLIHDQRREQRRLLQGLRTASGTHLDVRQRPVLLQWRV